jgi:hypothetical protein
MHTAAAIAFVAAATAATNVAAGSSGSHLHCPAYLVPGTVLQMLLLLLSSLS